MSEVSQIGEEPWSRQELIDSLEEFAEIYKKRPIKTNKGGMKSPGLFMMWYVLRRLKPEVVIESGVWKGLGTWCIEQACPDAKIYCLDLTFRHLEYKSSRAKYIGKDFSRVNWSNVSRNAVCFFDDHQNAFARLKKTKEFGFKHMMFEDNYPPKHGDCYSLKKILAGAGHKGVPANKSHLEYLREHLETYYEFPPVFSAKRIKGIVTKRPLLASIEEDHQSVYSRECENYTWMCYAKLK